MTMLNALEFGCVALPGTAATSLRGIGELADAARYDRFWVPDQEFFPDPFLILDDLAHRTTLDLGLAITSPFARHPVQIARAMASLVQLHEPERKWILGLGKGNSNLVLGPMGVDDGANASRLVAGIGVVKALLRGESVGPDQGEFVTSELQLGMDPVNCDVFLGTRGPLTLRRGAEAADGIIAESLFVPRMVSWVKEQVASDDGVEKPHVAWQAVIVLDEGEPIPDSARAFTAMLMRTTARQVLDLIGITEETRATIAAHSLEASRIPDADVRRFVAIGTPQQLRETVLAAADAGITGWTSIFLGDEGRISNQIRRFAEDVMDPVRSELSARGK